MGISRILRLKLMTAKEPNKYKRLWKSEARFIVAGANDFSLSQQIDFLIISQNR